VEPETQIFVAFIVLFLYLQYFTQYVGQWRTQEFFRGGGQQIQLRTEDRENGDLGVVAP
jgi:hypothetical protein